MQKILAIVTDGKEFLALRNNSIDSSHGGDFWFVITGAVERGESNKDAVIREVKEETNLDVFEIFDLNWRSLYKWSGENCEEDNYLALVKKSNICLNEENVEYKWLSLDLFVKLIKWDDDCKLLKAVLRKALKKQEYFKKKKLTDYTIKH